MEKTRKESSVVTKQQSDIFDTKTIVKKLENYMDRVTDTECNPATVQAAVNCADKIVDILRLHIEVERIKIRREK